MTAQAKAVTMQQLPPLPFYSGEGVDIKDDGFDKGGEQFQERARFAEWSASDQLYRLKQHLHRTALDVFRMLPEADVEDCDKLRQNDCDKAISALRKQFQPGGIEELQGLEFHRCVQNPDKSVEAVDCSIQHFGWKAFPSITSKDFDCLLKGRFYQALSMKRKRKLGPPKLTKAFMACEDGGRIRETVSCLSRIW